MAETLAETVSRIMRDGRWSEALDLMATHDSVVRETFDLAWNRGWAHFKLEQLEPAERWLRRALELKPNSHTTLWALGIVLREAGALDEAERRLLEALSIREAYIGRFGLVVLYLRQGRFDRAEAVSLEGLRLNPNSPRRLRAHADVLFDIGREDEAEQYYDRARQAEDGAATGQRVKAEDEGGE